MNLQRILQFSYINKQCLRSKIHNYATIYESNNVKNVGKSTKIKGWVKALRNMKNNIFLDVNDGTSCKSFQLVINKDLKPKNLAYGCSILAEGDICLAPNGKPELIVKEINVIGECELEGYPFYPRKKYSMDYVRQFLHFRPRTRTFSSIIRLRDLAMNIIRDYFRNQNFININTPILTSNDCEGAGELFYVQPNSETLLKDMKRTTINNEESIYFNKKAFMTVSGQLHLEVCARALSRVYNFSPTFRAENTKSRLHLSEFYMIEAEIAFMTSVKDLATEIEFLIKSITKSLFEKGIDELNLLKAPEPIWLEKDFYYITYEEALQILDKHLDKLTIPIKHGENLSKEHELFLIQHHEGVPVFITEWPKNIKPFYMKECKNDTSKVNALDLLVPTVGELVGGSVREDDYLKLQSKLPPTSNLDWYLDLRKYGNVPTAGFGMGFERYLQLVFGIPNIKDVIPFPRWPHNCNF